MQQVPLFVYGTMIGHNVMTGAGSIVTKDIPSYTAAVGNPHRIMHKAEEHDRAGKTTGANGSTKDVLW